LLQGDDVSNKLLDAAIGYANRGWPVFPCRADKTPLTLNGVQDATTDTRKIVSWWERWPNANVAMDVGGAGMMVLDLDPGHDLNELEAKIGMLPDTPLWQRTPRGGEHLFYTLAEGEVVPPSVSKLARKIDVRSFNSYVLLAPSRTADGEYEWQCDPIRTQATHRTDIMKNVASAHARERSSKHDEWIIAPDLPENVAAAVRWLSTDAKIAVEGAGGDAMAYATAAHLKSYGISEALALDLMWEHWNPRCIPPWDADELDHLRTKVSNGHRYNTSEPGNITEAYKAAKVAAMFAPAQLVTSRDSTGEPVGKGMTSGRFRIVDKVAAGNIKPPAWLLDNVIQAGSYSILFGAPGTFKTFVALDMALTIAQGPAWPTERVHVPMVKGPVLYVAGEGRSQIVNRVKAWERVHGEVPVDNFHLADPLPHAAEDIQAFIELALAMSPNGYDLVVLDTVGRAMQGLNENSQEHASKFTAMVEKLQRGLECAVLALHHAGHEAKDRTRGSTVFIGDADTMIRIDRENRATTVALTMVKQKDAIEWEQPLNLDLSDVTLTETLTSLAVTKHTPAQAVTPADAKAMFTASQTSTRTRAGRKQGQQVDVDADGVVDDALKRVLAANKLKDYSTNQLADLVAREPGVAYSPSAIRQTVLPRLRDDSSRHAWRAYRPAERRWRFYAEN